MKLARFVLEGVALVVFPAAVVGSLVLVAVRAWQRHADALAIGLKDDIDSWFPRSVPA